MSKAIDRILKHYREHEKQYIDVPEWADEHGVPLRIHWRLLTPADAKEIQRRSEAGENSDLDIFVRYALDSDGKKMFDAEDKLKLERAGELHIISRVARAMVGPAKVIEARVEVAVKN
jgi:hypothetical protein